MKIERIPVCLPGRRSSLPSRRNCVFGFSFVLLILGNHISVSAQDAAKDEDTSSSPPVEANSGEVETPTIAPKVEVNPQTSDDAIAQRLTEILETTGWFQSPSVQVDRGVAFLSGSTDTAAHRKWAEATAINTTDVVAVVNHISVTEPSIWDLTPAIQSLQQLGRETMQLLPLLLIAVIITVVFYFLAKLAAMIAVHVATRRIKSEMLRQVLANVAAVLIFVIGCYIALRTSGLTRLAVTVLGSTGLIGLALGFAFRDIAENYLASILLSLNHPFRVGDMIEVDGAQGIVRKVTTRGTILNTLEGNQLQIPNSTVYKSRIVNFTASPLLRLDFAVGIGFDVAVSDAQEVIMNVFKKHPAVETEPQPMVLVDALGSATVNLKCIYWINQRDHSPLKVGSSVIRLAKDALMKQGISMPDEAREIVFPDGVPVQMVGDEVPAIPASQTPPNPISSPRCEEATQSEGEGDLSNEDAEILEATRENEMSAERNLIA